MATRFSLRKSRFALIGALLVGLSAGAGCDSDMDPDPDPNPDLGDPVTPDREVIGADATVERVLASLGKFHQRLAGIPCERVRAIGTNSFRRSRDAGLLDRASDGSDG